jgi:hypothetical protein
MLGLKDKLAFIISMFVILEFCCIYTLEHDCNVLEAVYTFLDNSVMHDYIGNYNIGTNT